MFKFFDNHFVQAIILSLVGVLIASASFINLFFSIPFVALEIILIWQFNKGLDQRQDVKEIIDELNRKEKRISETFFKIIQTRKEIEDIAKEVKETKDGIKKMQEKTFSFISSARSFNSLEDRIKKIEVHIGLEQGYSSNKLTERVKKIEDAVKKITGKSWL